VFKEDDQIWPVPDRPGLSLFGRSSFSIFGRSDRGLTLGPQHSMERFPAIRFDLSLIGPFRLLETIRFGLSLFGHYSAMSLFGHRGLGTGPKLRLLERAQMLRKEREVAGPG
jgi:hypothetical protein